MPKLINHYHLLTNLLIDRSHVLDRTEHLNFKASSLGNRGSDVNGSACDGVSAGGWVGSEIGKTMERYDPAENKWEIIGNMAVPRYYFGCCELQG